METDNGFDGDGLREAARALSVRLAEEAEEQQAYLQRLADGKISLELEWLDLAPLARDAVAAYLAVLLSKGVSISPVPEAELLP